MKSLLLLTVALTVASFHAPQSGLHDLFCSGVGSASSAPGTPHPTRPANQCELIEIITADVVNIACPGGATNCVDMVVNGVAPGTNGTCPDSCTGAAYSLTITYNGCPVAGCCGGGVVRVDATGQLPRFIANVGGTTSLTVGPAKPGCGGGALNVLTISCQTTGAVLMQVSLNSFCDFCG